MKLRRNDAILFISFIMLFFNLNSLYGDQPRLKSPLEIKEIKINGQPIVGREFKIAIKYMTVIDTDVNVVLQISSNLSSTNKKELSQKIIKRSLKTTKRVVSVEHFSLRVDKEGSSIIQVFFEVPNAPPGYSRSISRYIKISSRDNGYQIIDPTKSTGLKPKEIGKDIKIKTGNQPENDSLFV